MPLGADNVVHENTGTSATGTSHVVSLAGTDSTTAGNTVMVFFAAATGMNPALAGFTNVKTNFALYALVKSEVAAGESSWTFSTAGSSITTWYVVELSNVDAVEPLDASASANATVGNGGTLSTGTTGLNAGLSTVQFAVFGGGAHTSSSWAGYTNGFTEVADVSGSASTIGMAVARNFLNDSTGTFESTATLTTSSGASATYAMMLVFRAADAPIVAPLATFCGFDWGTHGGATATTGAAGLFGGQSAQQGTWGTSYLIQAASARNSAYGLRIVQAGASGAVRLGTMGGVNSAAAGFNVRVISATGTPVVAAIFDGTGFTPYAQLLYDSAATKFGIRVMSTGATSWATTTTALNTWVWIDWRLKISTATYHAEWRLETAADTYTDQPAADLAGQTPSPGALHQLQLGNNAAQTLTADFDDAILSKYYVAYPLGPHEIRLLTVDPAGTPTTSGATQTWRRFTANGTLDGSFVAASVRDALDEVPVNVSSTADGVVGTTSSATDYLEVPMSTYTLGATEYIAGVRMLAPLWSGTGAGAGDLTIKGWDGTTETTLATASQITPGSPTAVSSTAPVWRCGMWQSTNGWSQAELDAAALRFLVPDGTPDMGVGAAYLEVAIGKTKTSPLFGSSVSAELDPTRLGVVSVTATAPDSGAVSLYYEQGGSPTTVPVTAGSTVVSQVNSEMAPDTNYVAAYWPPEGVPDA